MKENETVETTLCFRKNGNDIEIDIKVKASEIVDYIVERDTKRGMVREYYDAARDNAWKTVGDDGFDPYEIIGTDGFTDYIKPFYEDLAR